jgi:translation initiation factor IF-2
VVTDEKARQLAEQKGVDIRLYSVIYEILGDLKKALEGMLAPERKEQVVGHALVRQTFKVSRVGTVAGCYVTDGLIRRNSKVRISRQGIVVHEGELDSLKRFKDDVREVGAGLECGMKIRGFDDLKVDDHIDAVETIELKRKFE